VLDAERFVLRQGGVPGIRVEALNGPKPVEEILGYDGGNEAFADTCGFRRRKSLVPI